MISRNIGSTIHVEPNSGMTEELRDVKKISCAAAQIENALGTRQVEFELANPPDVNSDPPIEIEIFRPVRAGICYGISLANLLETGRIDCLDDALSSPSGKRFGRSSLSVCFLALARLLPSTSFLFYGEVSVSLRTGR